MLEVINSFVHVLALLKNLAFKSLLYIIQLVILQLVQHLGVSFIQLHHLHLYLSTYSDSCARLIRVAVGSMIEMKLQQLPLYFIQP